ncbi:hypothetical protein MAR_000874, partial [Mya arenaria]
RLDYRFDTIVSVLKEHVEATNFGHLLGDSGYPLKRFLLKPYLHPVSPALMLSKSGGYLPFSPEKSANVIFCCFKLHNLCLSRGLSLPDIIPNDDDSQTHAVDEKEVGRGGIQRRNELTQLFLR